MSTTCDYSPPTTMVCRWKVSLASMALALGTLEATGCREGRRYYNPCRTDLFGSSLGNLITWNCNKITLWIPEKR